MGTYYEVRGVMREQTFVETPCRGIRALPFFVTLVEPPADPGTTSVTEPVMHALGAVDLAEARIQQHPP